MIGFLIIIKNIFFTYFYFQYDFRSSGSTADLLTVVSDRIARAYSSCSTRNIQGFLQNFFIKSGLRAFQTEFLSLFLHFSVFSTLSNLMILLFYCQKGRASVFKTTCRLHSLSLEGFFPPSLFFISINITSDLAWNAISCLG